MVSFRRMMHTCKIRNEYSSLAGGDADFTTPSQGSPKIVKDAS